MKAIVKSTEYEDISILVKMDNLSHYYLCECGEAKSLKIKEVRNIKAIFISHTHIDHFIGFDFVLRHQLGIKRTVVICGPSGIANQVHSKLNGYIWNLVKEGDISYEIRELHPNDTIKKYTIEAPDWKMILENEKCIENIIYEEDSFYVKATLLDHKIDSMAYLFKQKDTIHVNIEASGYKGGKWVGDLIKAYNINDRELPISIEGKDYKAGKLFHLFYEKKGKTLGVIMDHSFSAENHKKINALFKNTDEVYIESFYKNEDMDFAIKNYHSYARKSGELMKACNVKKSIPVHFSRRYGKEDIIELKEQFYVAFNSEIK